MKRFIRHRKTRKFLTSDGLWVSGHQAARVFADIKAVCAAMQQHQLENVESVLMLGDDLSKGQDIIVPLPFLDPKTGRPWVPKE
jgi:hypothetical protein